MLFLRRFLSRYSTTCLLASIAGFLAISLCSKRVEQKSFGRHFSDLAQVPPHRVALVLGCSEKLRNGRENLYFKYRMETAVKAYQAGKCQYFLLSGDNSRDDYNEPESMRKALIRLGVPANSIHLDYAGFRTFDSVIRAKDVFQESRMLVISQQFHNERAIYIAQNNGVELTGINARDVRRLGGWKTKLREKLARAKTILDVHLLGATPKFLGSPILIGDAGSG